jgi:hypothetical protein
LRGRFSLHAASLPRIPRAAIPEKNLGKAP